MVKSFASIGSEMNLTIQDIAFYAFLALCGVEIVILYYLILIFMRIESKVDILLSKKQKKKKQHK